MPVLTYPPLDFPVYGLDHSWAGPRWLAHLDGRDAHPVLGVSLMHGTHVDTVGHPGPWARVVTNPGRRWQRQSGPDLVSQVALLAWMNRDARSTSDQFDEAESDAANYREWTTTGWSLDGVVAEAALVPDRPEAGGAWAGFTAVFDVFVIVAARGIRPSDIRLTNVGSGSDYHTDFTKPLTHPTSVNHSRSRALGSRT